MIHIIDSLSKYQGRYIIKQTGTREELMFVAAQISVYPLRQKHLSPAIDNALSTLKERGLEVKEGTMSSVVSGEDEVLFEALKDIYRKTTEQGDIVMVITFSNACPVPL
jgi:uncharacterized protein YqgV (UPF0045/DUF77 family)